MVQGALVLLQLRVCFHGQTQLDFIEKNSQHRQKPVSSSGVQAQGGAEAAGASPEEAQDEQRDGAALLGEKPGRAGVVQSAEEKLWGDLIVAFSTQREPARKMERPFTRAWND